MNSVLEAQIVLSLNTAWQPIGWRTPKQAIVSMTSIGEQPAALAVDVTLDENGTPIISRAMGWDEWVKLPVQEGQLSITTKSGAIRVPLVIINPAFSKMPVNRKRLSPSAIMERDGGVCQYSGKKLTRKGGSIDHILPKSKGGKDSWENLVWCDKTINSNKGNRLNHEIGLKLLKKPLAPKPVPASFSIKAARRPEHEPFISK